MWLVITDLDGTLLDHHTYSFAEAVPALHLLKEIRVPVVCCTSKTRAETEYWREQMGISDPFVVENGGAVIWADRVSILGTPIEELRATLSDAAAEVRCRITAFGQMTPEEIAACTALTVEQARLAAQREYDEPFLLHNESAAPALIRAIEARGKRHTKGGRFHHITGNNDKGRAVAMIIAAYRERDPDLKTLGLGDAPNDEAFLILCDVAARVSDGPREWAAVVLQNLRNS